MHIGSVNKTNETISAAEIFNADFNFFLWSFSSFTYSIIKLISDRNKSTQRKKLIIPMPMQKGKK